MAAAASSPLSGGQPTPPQRPSTGPPNDGTTEPSTPVGADPKTGRPIAYYAEDSGTSMAAPHVSGAIAAFLSIRGEFIGQPEAVKQLFCETAISLGRDRFFQGHGLVDLMGVLSKV